MDAPRIRAIVANDRGGGEIQIDGMGRPLAVSRVELRRIRQIRD
jgi:hypothetical protein